MEAIKLKVKVNSSFVRLDTRSGLAREQMVRHKKEHFKNYKNNNSIIRFGKISTQPYTSTMHTCIDSIHTNYLCEKVCDCCIHYN